ncbi:ABC transporter substrate-binding protein [Mycobacterium sp.]|uniref:ABC transporter substrate-binding protein n=1 Tax=Mycobacterium sp. TaxID=1785 RepID=UPI002C947817|nr:ABC transporter substrate-binding protein [Mycobacterium sp.]HTY35354.1 ABC transporter substrate-binding protein [Mycobacterium sp.]
MAQIPATERLFRPSTIDSASGTATGTLRLIGPASIDCLDPAAAQPPHMRQVMRLLTRQLLSHEPRPNLHEWRAISAVPDAAVDVPSTYNMGLGASHRCYVVHLRPRVMWATTPPRAVTAHDFIRGLKRMCNPWSRPPGLTYFRSAIRGMAEFCDGFRAAVLPVGPKPELFAAYQNAHEIEGVFALDDETLVIELVRPTPDFVEMLTLTCASAAPVEYDAFLPGSMELSRNLISNGPYRVAQLIPGERLRLEPNPAWQPDTDPLRSQRLEAIEITVESATPKHIARAINFGMAHLPWGSPICDSVALSGSKVSWALDPYVVFNFTGPSTELRNQLVRQAISVVINKAALADICRACSPRASVQVADSIVPPNNDAHEPPPAGGAASRGDAAAARELLTQAAHAEGFTLLAVHGPQEIERRVMRSIASDLGRAGIDIRIRQVDRGDVERLAAGVAPTGPWDLTTRSCSADWHHDNGRVFLQSLFETEAVCNVGGFSNREVDELIVRALELAIDAPSRAVGAWQDVERRVQDMTVVVPLLFQSPAVHQRNGHVLNAMPMPALGFSDDLASLWLTDRHRSNGEITEG